jgi:hypothetical protein
MLVWRNVQAGTISGAHSHVGEWSVVLADVSRTPYTIYAQIVVAFLGLNVHN